MHAKVVEEVMPLPEKHLASTEVAFEELDMPLGARIFVLENPELPSGRNLLFNLDACKVKACPTLHADPCPMRDLISNRVVGNLIPRDNQRTLGI